MRSPSVLGLGLLLAVSASAQQGELRARELFYTPITETKAKTDEPKQNEAKSAAKTEVKPPVRRDRPTTGGTRPQGDIQANRNETPTLPSGARIQHASVAAEQGGPPLALKYRLLKLSASGAYDEVDTDSVFHSGDKIRFSVESNDAAYLYIVQQGSSKTWKLLFPNEDSENGNNHIARNREYEIPSGGLFSFDEQAGSERIYIILSRRPEADLEKLIYSLSQGSNAAKPAVTDKTAEPSRMMIAQDRIGDDLIARLRERDKFLARDLVFEKVNDAKPTNTPSGARKEKALYVATPDRTAAARIVVDLNLKHE